MGSNHEDEDIDIVGDDHTHNNNNNNNNRNSSMSSSDASRDLQLHVYGPPQFSEADVLACMMNVNEQGNENREVSGKKFDEGDYIKAENTSPCSVDMLFKDEMDSDDGERKRLDSEKEEVETLKAKLKKLESSSKCSKCTVNDFFKVIKQQQSSHCIFIRNLCRIQLLILDVGTFSVKSVGSHLW